MEVCAIYTIRCPQSPSAIGGRKLFVTKKKLESKLGSQHYAQAGRKYYKRHLQAHFCVT